MGATCHSMRLMVVKGASSWITWCSLSLRQALCTFGGRAFSVVLSLSPRTNNSAMYLWVTLGGRKLPAPLPGLVDLCFVSIQDLWPEQFSDCSPGQLALTSTHSSVPLPGMGLESFLTLLQQQSVSASVSPCKINCFSSGQSFLPHPQHQTAFVSIPSPEALSLLLGPWGMTEMSGKWAGFCACVSLKGTPTGPLPHPSLSCEHLTDIYGKRVSE